MQISTAIIPVAGVGSRMQPATAAIDKSMQPVYAGDQAIPIIDFMVRECAGCVERIVFVTTERGKLQLSSYFESLDGVVEQQLLHLGKQSLIEAERQRRASYNVHFEYIIQPPDVYGTTVPPYLAKAILQGEKRFALMGGDDFIYHPDGQSELQLALDAWQQNNTDHLIMGHGVPHDDGPRYGILQQDPQANLLAIDEKPPLERVPDQPIANISRYLFSDSIWEHIDNEMQRDVGNSEHFITNPIAAALQANQRFYVYPVAGQYLDGGTPAGLLYASQYVSRQTGSR